MPTPAEPTRDDGRDGRPARWAKPHRPSRLASAATGLALGLVAGTLVAELAGERAGLPAEGRDWVLATICAPLGARIAAHAARNACGWLILGVGLLAAATVATSISASEVTVWLRDWLWWPSYGLLILVALLFPDGRPASSRWRWVIAGMTATIVAGTTALASLAVRAPRSLLTGDVVIGAGWDSVLFLAATVALLVGAVLSVVALLIRICRRSTPARGALVWAVLNAALLLVAIVLDAALDVPLMWLAGALAMPAAATIGVLRYGLYDIGLLVHRSLLFGLLTVAVIGAYAGAVMLAAWLAPDVAAPAAAVVTVMAVLPLRQGVQALLERGLYGLSSRPYDLVAALSRRIGLAHTPQQILAAAVDAVAEGLKSPFAAVHLGERGTPEATYGTRRPWPVATLTLAHRGHPIGRLVVQQRSPDEPWSRREQALLSQLAQQLGPSAASVALTRDLQAARERLVRTREEELRRLQRELHDGVGPALSGARMLVKGARARAGNGLVDLLGQLDDGLADAATELRRIIDDLRPPALDRGLPAALDAAVRRHRSPELDIALNVAGHLHDLPAAVEVAAYRVVDEALTNVAKHAEATRATVTVRRDARGIGIDVDDNGAGTPTPRRDGVGLDSMRQRCQELGGALRIVALVPGTRIAATIPLG